ncbi:hypothetical protein CRENBAI_006255 [Crenichthys baileyi]|uniref:Uncharacterized protein n=1 Tax=Crenichthys baileyi TaxID=28760 RepID=A0AAV9S0G6_9TELE
MKRSQPEAHSDDQECSFTPKKRADHPAHRNKNKRTESASASQTVKQIPRYTTPPTTMPMGKTPVQQVEGCHRRATARTAKRLQPTPPETHNHQHPGQPSKNNKAKPHLPPSQRHSNSNTTHPSIRDTVKTTNAKHTPPTRNHTTDKQTPPQYKAEKPHAITKPSDARPTAPTHDGQSRIAQDHHHSTPYSEGQNAAKSIPLFNGNTAIAKLCLFDISRI